MAWRFLRSKRPTTPPAPTAAAASGGPLPTLSLEQRAYNRAVVRHWFALGVAPALYPAEMTTRGRYPCAGRDQAAVLREVLGWQEAGPKPGRRR